MKPIYLLSDPHPHLYAFHPLLPSRDDDWSSLASRNWVWRSWALAAQSGQL
jgi:hypothetical protein